MIKKSSLLQWRRVQILSATFFCISLSLVSCKKDPLIGKSALDPSSLLGSNEKDTFQLKTYTIEEDSVATKNPDRALLGAYNDPVFGTVNASFYTQISLSNPGFTDFGSDVTIDSVMLSLQYTGYYGEATAQNFEVYEVTEALDASADAKYYTFTNVNYNQSNDLVVPGQGTITPKPNTYARVGNDTLAPQLRIPLKTAFASQLMAGVANYTTQETFREFFKGIYVKVTNTNPASGTGGVLYFNLSAINSKLTIYYKNGTSAKTFAYLMNNNNVDFNHVDFNRTGKPIDNVINNPAAGQSQFYAQAFTSRAAIEFPSVSNIPKNSVIHKAQLILPLEHYTNNLLYPSLRFTVGTRISATNDTIYTRIENSVVVYDDVQKAYVIDVRKHIEEVVSEKIANRGLFIRPTYFNSTVERIIFNGPETTNKKKPKLVVTYTTY